MTGLPQGKLFEGVGMESGAIFSPCEKWRYVLWRVWDSELPMLISIGLNPSTADAVYNDRTVSKMIKYAKSLGYGGIIKLNVYAWRAKFPKEMMRQGVAAIGDLNDYWIQAVEQTFGPAGRDVIGMRIACWGQHDFLNRGAVIQQYIPDLHHFGLNGNGTPKHPLYLPLGSISLERLPLAA